MLEFGNAENNIVIYHPVALSRLHVKLFNTKLDELGLKGHSGDREKIDISFV